MPEGAIVNVACSDAAFVGMPPSAETVDIPAAASIASLELGGDARLARHQKLEFDLELEAAAIALNDAGSGLLDSARVELGPAPRASDRAESLHSPSFPPARLIASPNIFAASASRPGIRWP